MSNQPISGSTVSANTNLITYIRGEIDNKHWFIIKKWSAPKFPQLVIINWNKIQFDPLVAHTRRAAIHSLTRSKAVLSALLFCVVIMPFASTLPAPAFHTTHSRTAPTPARCLYKSNSWSVFSLVKERRLTAQHHRDSVRDRRPGNRRSSVEYIVCEALIVEI